MSLWAGKDWVNDLSINRLMDLQYEGQDLVYRLHYVEIQTYRHQ